jgi:MscS family membrane protein
MISVMKYLIIILFSLTSFAQITVDLSTPRSTFQTYLTTMTLYKNQELDKTQMLEIVRQTFDSSQLDTNSRVFIIEQAAIDLVQTIDRIEKIKFKNIPTSVDKNVWTYKADVVEVGGSKYPVEIALHKVEDKWLFTPNTLTSIQFFYRSVAHKPVIKGVTELADWKKSFKAKFPEWTAHQTFLLSNGQWLAIFVVFLLSFLISRTIRFIIEFVVNRKLVASYIAYQKNDKKRLSRPFGYFAGLALWSMAIKVIELTPKTLSFLVGVTKIGYAIIIPWIALEIVNLMAYFFEIKFERASDKYGRILIPLLKTFSNIIIYAIGLLIFISALGFEVDKIIAGLGIGGLAFALAAKDTIANLFGSVMIVLDKPFEIGDWVVLGNGVEGTIEAVGFRSTRIRTFYDSLISIPNMELTNMHIENYAKREYRRMRIFVGVQYDTPPEKIEAFCEGIRQIIIKHERTRKDSFHVYFNQFNNSSLDILIQAFWKVPDYATEANERHRLLLNILRLGNEMGVDFAFPTQTVHLYNEQAKSHMDDYLSAEPKMFHQKGREFAQNIASKPYSFKNARSGVTSGDDFSDDEISN